MVSKYDDVPFKNLFSNTYWQFLYYKTCSYHIQHTVTMYLYKLYKTAKQRMLSCHDNNLANLSFSWVVEIVYNP